MPTTEFIRYKFKYDNDDGTSRIAVQRVYVRTEDSRPLTAITPLFEARIEPDQNVIAIESANLRYVDVCSENEYNSTGFSTTKTFILYRPGNPNLKAQIREIYGVEWVKSVTYYGENSIF